jgi:Bacterial regulatory proteins, gntR family/Helix-turn-helix domain
VAPLKREAVTALVRDMIADGTLLPGAPVPAGTELARKTGYCPLTCRRALRALLADGTLTPGASPTARLRVATAGGGMGRAAVRAPLSAALAARRHAAGMLQPELADLLGVSLTTVGHAETGRLWQARDFWQRADRELGGGLLRMYDQHQAAGGHPAGEGHPEPPPPSLLPVSITITPEGVAVLWPDGTETLARPPGWPGVPENPGTAPPPPAPSRAGTDAGGNLPCARTGTSPTR